MSQRGKVNRNVVLASTAVSAEMSPPWRAMMRCTMASPTPVPSIFLGAVQPLEDAEQLAVVFHVEAGAVVAHDSTTFLAGDGAFDLDARPRGGGAEFQGIAQQLDRHLPQQRRIAACRRQRLHLDLGILGSDRMSAQLVDHVLHQRRHVDLAGCHWRPAEPGEGQQIVDQLPHAPGVLADGGEALAASRTECVVMIFFENRGVLVDRAQRGAQIVRDRIAEALQLLVAALQLVGAFDDAALQLRLGGGVLYRAPALVQDADTEVHGDHADQRDQAVGNEDAAQLRVARGEGLLERLFGHHAPAVLGHRLEGDEAVDVAQRILGDLLAALARQHALHQRKVRQADRLSLRRHGGMERDRAGAIDRIEMAARAEVDLAQPGEEAFGLHLQNQDPDILACLALDRNGHGDDVDLRRRSALVDDGDIGLPVGGDALVPVAVGEVLAAQARGLRNVGHLDAVRIAEEDPDDGGEVLWHAGHDLHRFVPLALRNQIAEAQARCQRDADIHHAVELLGDGGGGEIGQ